MTEKTIKGNPLARGERLQIMLDPAELAALDEFRFSHHMPSRAAAVRELLKRGLAAEGFMRAGSDQASGHFGVVTTGRRDRDPLTG
jgi:hypothetical protein